jgi:hypothetical protein
MGVKAPPVSIQWGQASCSVNPFILNGLYDLLRTGYVTCSDGLQAVQVVMSGPIWPVKAGVVTSVWGLIENRRLAMQKRFLWIVLIGFLAGCAYYGPPGRHGFPPGHGGIPPGQAKKYGPPPIAVIGGPRYAVVPGSAVSVLLGVDTDVFFVSGVHYYFYDSLWYSSKYYYGPWKRIAANRLPRGLRGKSPKLLKAKINGYNGKVKRRGKGKGKGKWK